MNNLPCSRPIKRLYHREQSVKYQQSFMPDDLFPLTNNWSWAINWIISLDFYQKNVIKTEDLLFVCANPLWTVASQQMSAFKSFNQMCTLISTQNYGWYFVPQRYRDEPKHTNVITALSISLSEVLLKAEAFSFAFQVKNRRVKSAQTRSLRSVQRRPLRVAFENRKLIPLEQHQPQK